MKSGHSKDCTRRWCGGCLPEAESCAYEVPPSGLITGVSGSFIIVDVVRFCVCNFLFLILSNCDRSDKKITNKQKRSTLLAVLATSIRTVLVQIKKFYSK